MGGAVTCRGHTPTAAVPDAVARKPAGRTAASRTPEKDTAAAVNRRGSLFAAGVRPNLTWSAAVVLGRAASPAHRRLVSATAAGQWALLWPTPSLPTPTLHQIYW